MTGGRANSVELAVFAPVSSSLLQKSEDAAAGALLSLSSMGRAGDETSQGGKRTTTKKRKTENKGMISEIQRRVLKDLEVFQKRDSVLDQTSEYLRMATFHAVSAEPYTSSLLALPDFSYFISVIS